MFCFFLLMVRESWWFGMIILVMLVFLWICIFFILVGFRVLVMKLVWLLEKGMMSIFLFCSLVMIMWTWVPWVLM